jgi:hypothetical protein
MFHLTRESCQIRPSGSLLASSSPRARSEAYSGSLSLVIPHTTSRSRIVDSHSRARPLCWPVAGFARATSATPVPLRCHSGATPVPLRSHSGPTPEKCLPAARLYSVQILHNEGCDSRAAGIAHRSNLSTCHQKTFGWLRVARIQGSTRSSGRIGSAPTAISCGKRMRRTARAARTACSAADRPGGICIVA